MLGFDALAALPLASGVPAAAGGSVTLSLAVTESSDVAAVSADAIQSASLAVTESSDVAAVTVTAYHTVVMSVTESSDTVAVTTVTGANFTMVLGATESSDAAAFVVDAGAGGSVSVYGVSGPGIADTFFNQTSVSVDGHTQKRTA